MKKGRDADATVLRSLDAHNIPSRPQQREVGQDAGRARQELGDLLQCLGGFQMPSPFGHEAIAMPWTWAPQTGLRRIYVRCPIPINYSTLIHWL